MMKNKLSLFVLLLIPQLFFAQQVPREMLFGQIVSDSVKVESVRITNKTTQRYSLTDTEGNFNLLARVKDTLVFSGMSYQSRMLVLTAADFKVKVLRIQMDMVVNELDEVIINPNSLTGDLEVDNKNIKVAEIEKIDVQVAQQTIFEDDTKSSPENTLMPGYVDTRFMMDFVALGKKFLKVIKKNDNSDQKVVYTSTKIFPEAVQDKISEGFFTEVLKLKPSEIGLFLSYCETDPKAQSLLAADKEFDLIEFLILKRDDYVNAIKE